jgi:putative transposase
VPARTRKILPHEPPLAIDFTREWWFITICARPQRFNQLAAAAPARIIFESVDHRQQRGVWFCHLLLLMPDHLHMVVQFPDPPLGSANGYRSAPMQRVIAQWKRWLAERAGIAWQRDFFDHRLRRDESFTAKTDYILANPVRAGLVTREEDWPYIWQPEGQAPFTGLHR